MTMTWHEYLNFAAHALRSYTTRTVLIVLAMSLGVASVIALTALGEGARIYINNQFASLGTNLLIVVPGRSETSGINPAAMVGRSVRDLTIDDANALLHSPYVSRVAPVMVGAVPIAYGAREREAVIMGTTSDMQPIRNFVLAQGQFLPEGEASRATAVCVIGSKIRDELFGPANALGEWVRVGGWRFRVAGVLVQQGQTLGMNNDEVIMIPVASAQAMLNSPSLFRIFVEAKSHDVIDKTRQQIRSIITTRHQGEEDITVVTQDAVLATFNKIIGALTLAIGGIAAISLIVAGILIMNVMLVAVTQRTSEIGLLKALGASKQQIMRLFLVEAVLLAIVGCAVGIVVGILGTAMLRSAFPSFPAQTPPWAFAMAVFTAIGTAMIFSFLPSRRAAALNAVTALARH